MLASLSVHIDKLIKDNYDTWKLHVKAILVKTNLWSYVDELRTKLETLADATIWEKNDRKARADIILVMSSSELCHIKSCTTSREVKP